MMDFPKIRAKISVLAYIGWQEVHELKCRLATSVCPVISRHGKRIQSYRFDFASRPWRLIDGNPEEGGARLHWQVSDN